MSGTMSLTTTPKYIMLSTHKFCCHPPYTPLAMFEPTHTTKASSLHCRSQQIIPLVKTHTAVDAFLASRASPASQSLQLACKPGTMTEVLSARTLLEMQPRPTAKTNMSLSNTCKLTLMMCAHGRPEAVQLCPLCHCWLAHGQLPGGIEHASRCVVDESESALLEVLPAEA